MLYRCSMFRLHIPSFRLRDNSVYLVGALPFGKVFSLCLKDNCLLFNVDMHILIGKALRHLYML